MSVSSQDLSSAGYALSRLARWLDDEGSVLAGAVGDGASDLEVMAGGWHGPLPTMLNTAGSTYIQDVKPAGGAAGSLADIIGRWSGVAAALHDELAAAERQLTSADEVVVGDVPADSSAGAVAASRVTAAREAWQTECVRFIGELATDVATLEACRKAVVSGLPYPRSILTGGAFLVEMCQLLYLYNNPGGIAPDPETQLTFDIVDPSGQLKAQAEAADELLDTDGALFTALETSDDGDIDAADDHASWDDHWKAAHWDEAETQIRQLNEQLGLNLSDEEIAAMTMTLMAGSWVRIAAAGTDPADALDYEGVEGDEWLAPEMADLEESGTDFAATLNPFEELQQTEAWAPHGQDEYRLMALLSPWIPPESMHSNGPSLVDEFLAIGEFFTDFIFDSDAVIGDDADGTSAGIEVVGVLPFGKVIKWFGRAADLFRVGENLQDGMRVAVNVQGGVHTAENVGDGVHVVENATTTVVERTDEGTLVFRETSETVDNEASEAIDDALEEADGAVAAPDEAAATSDETAATADEASESADNVETADDAGTTSDDGSNSSEGAGDEPNEGSAESSGDEGSQSNDAAGSGDATDVTFTDAGSGDQLRRNVEVDGVDITINSGHGYRPDHPGQSSDITQAMPRDQVDGAIAQDLADEVNANASIPTVADGYSELTVVVNGQNVYYRAVFNASTGTYHVSTYYL